MMSDLLSQDEINALLSGGMPAQEDSPAPESSGGGGIQLSAAEEKALADMASVFTSSLQSVFGMLTGKAVGVDNVKNETLSQMDIVSAMEPSPFVLRAKCGGLKDLPLAIAMPQRGAQLLSDMMMGGEGKDLSGELSELDMSASQEGLSQVLGSAFTSLSAKLSGGRLMPDGISAIVEEGGWEIFPNEDNSEICSAKLNISVPDLSSFEMFVLLPQKLITTFADMAAAAAVPAAPAAPAPSSAAPQRAQEPAQAASAPQPQFNLPMGAQQPGPVVDVRPAEFSPLSVRGGANMPSRMDLVADIPVRVTVELGRTRKNISEVLNMSAGSVIELDKMAGEPVDVLVNGKLIAKGEVVVIDENFGVRITEIINSVSRAYS